MKVKQGPEFEMKNGHGLNKSSWEILAKKDNNLPGQVIS